MYTGVNLLLVKYFIKSISIIDIHLIELNFLSYNLLNPLDWFLAGIDKVVHYNNIITCIHKFYHGMASDKARSTCNKNWHS